MMAGDPVLDDPGERADKDSTETGSPNEPAPQDEMRQGDLSSDDLDDRTEKNPSEPGSPTTGERTEKDSAAHGRAPPRTDEPTDKPPPPTSSFDLFAFFSVLPCHDGRTFKFKSWQKGIASIIAELSPEEREHIRLRDQVHRLPQDTQDLFYRFSAKFKNRVADLESEVSQLRRQLEASEQRHMKDTHRLKMYDLLWDSFEDYLKLSSGRLRQFLGQLHRKLVPSQQQSQAPQAPQAPIERKRGRGDDDDDNERNEDRSKRFRYDPLHVEADTGDLGGDLDGFDLSSPKASAGKDRNRELLALREKYDKLLIAVQGGCDLLCAQNEGVRLRLLARLRHSENKIHQLTRDVQQLEEDLTLATLVRTENGDMLRERDKNLRRKMLRQQLPGRGAVGYSAALQQEKPEAEPSLLAKINEARRHLNKHQQQTQQLQDEREREKKLMQEQEPESTADLQQLPQVCEGLHKGDTQLLQQLEDVDVLKGRKRTRNPAEEGAGPEDRAHQPSPQKRRREPAI